MTTLLTADRDDPPPIQNCAAAGAVPAPARRVALSAVLNLGATLITAVAAALALILSITTWNQGRTPPELDFSLAEVMRVQSWDPFVDSPRFAVFLTPVFVLSHRSDSPVRITEVTLEVRRPDVPGEEGVKFIWQGFAQIEVEEGREEATLSGDPSPFVISMDNPGGRTMQFSRYFTRPQQRNYLNTGEWTLRMTVRYGGGESRSHDYCARLSDEIVDDVNDVLRPGQMDESRSRLWPLHRGGSGIGPELSDRQADCFAE